MNDEHPPTLLVVDDDRHIREVARLLLEDRGYRVLTAESGAQALVRARELDQRLDGARLDGALLDLGLPDASGVDVFLELRSIWPDLPALVATGHAADEARSLFGAAQPFDFLTKPYRLDDLLERIEAMLGGSA